MHLSEPSPFQNCSIQHLTNVRRGRHIYQTHCHDRRNDSIDAACRFCLCRHHVFVFVHLDEQIRSVPADRCHTSASTAVVALINRRASASAYLVRDNDRAYGGVFTSRVKAINPMSRKKAITQAVHTGSFSGILPLDFRGTLLARWATCKDNSRENWHRD